MGLKEGSKPTGKFPGARDAAFVRRCQWFLLEQVRIQQPRLLLTLGKEVPPVLAPLAPALHEAWAGMRTLCEMDRRGVGLVGPIHFPATPHPTVVVALTHPANRAPNVQRRWYQGLEGDAAEQALLRDALERVDDQPRRQIMRQHAPMTSVLTRLAHAVEDFARVVPPLTCGFGQQRQIGRDEGPFLVADIRGVGFAWVVRIGACA